MASPEVMRSIYFGAGNTDKPNFVVDDHLSSLVIADELKRTTYLVLAPQRVCRVCTSPCRREGFYLHVSPLITMPCGLGDENVSVASFSLFRGCRDPLCSCVQRGLSLSFISPSAFSEGTRHGRVLLRKGARLYLYSVAVSDAVLTLGLLQKGCSDFPPR